MTEPGPTTGRSGHSAGAARHGRPATAASSKIAVTGLGLTTMFGLVAGMAATAEPASPETTEAAGDSIVVVGPAPTTTALPPVQATLPTTAPTPQDVPPSAAPTAAPTTAPTPPTTARPRPEPLVLTPRPTVRPAPASEAPSGRTGGSR